MKISLNKEYAIRHLGVAILFFGLSLYFLYDAIFVYPYLPADGTHHTTVEFQYSSAALLALFASLLFGRELLLLANHCRSANHEQQQDKEHKKSFHGRAVGYFTRP